ncbi:peptide chain release factor-like protein [Lentisphaera marina]|uniref:peptide chain release factor family protein n=1 Tax=Lentisphaera marina TaxID=1111041 RepID=UPI002366BD4A|nr:peptide chain release factor-like protein [Lentisphaera marina]MDD7986728.1 peptide chain release factor-like protein [Lentisphaera marina]
MGRQELLLLGDEDLLNLCSQDFFKASGPGGQKKNKTSSAVRLIHKESGIQASASEDRQQSVNKKRALRRLRLELALQIREDFSPWKGEWNMNEKNDLYAVLVATLIDGLEECNYQVSDLSKKLSLSTSALIKVLHKSQIVWRFVNEQRQKRNLKALK